MSTISSVSTSSSLYLYDYEDFNEGEEEESLSSCDEEEPQGGRYDLFENLNMIASSRFCAPVFPWSINYETKDRVTLETTYKRFYIATPNKISLCKKVLTIESLKGKIRAIFSENFFLPFSLTMGIKTFCLNTWTEEKLPIKWSLYYVKLGVSLKEICNGRVLKVLRLLEETSSVYRYLSNNESVAPNSLSGVLDLVKKKAFEEKGLTCAHFENFISYWPSWIMKKYKTLRCPSVITFLNFVLRGYKKQHDVLKEWGLLRNVVANVKNFIDLKDSIKRQWFDYKRVDWRLNAFSFSDLEIFRNSVIQEGDAIFRFESVKELKLEKDLFLFLLKFFKEVTEDPSKVKQIENFSNDNRAWGWFVFVGLVVKPNLTFEEASIIPEICHANLLERYRDVDFQKDVEKAILLRSAIFIEPFWLGKSDKKREKIADQFCQLLKFYDSRTQTQVLCERQVPREIGKDVLITNKFSALDESCVEYVFSNPVPRCCFECLEYEDGEPRVKRTTTEYQLNNAKEFFANFFPSKNTCCICKEASSNYMFLKCAHVCMCERCCGFADACPICREKSIKIKVFI